MTARQREVLEFIRVFGERHGVPPTVREIGEKFEFTARAAFDHLRALERKGMLERRGPGQGAGRTPRGARPKGARGAGAMRGPGGRRGRGGRPGPPGGRAVSSARWAASCGRSERSRRCDEW